MQSHSFVLTSRNFLAFILASYAVVLTPFIDAGSLAWVGLIIAVSLLMWPIALLVDFAPLQRAVLLLSNLGTLDLNQILQAEHSGGIRIAPLIIYIRDASTADLGFWFG